MLTKYQFQNKTGMVQNKTGMAGQPFFH